jgi:hypothetical protein
VDVSYAWMDTSRKSKDDLRDVFGMPDLPRMAIMKFGEGSEVVITSREWKAEL